MNSLDPARRQAAVVRLRPEQAERYRALHAQLPKDVGELLTQAGVRNYSIYERDGLLFSYLEYTGLDYSAAMDAVSAQAAMRRWLALTDPCQQPLATARSTELWSPATEIFHLA